MVNHVVTVFRVENLVPVFIFGILLFHYYRYRLKDYLLFAGVFMMSFLSQFFTIESLIHESAFNYQAVFIVVTLHFFLLLLHVHRINNKDLYSVGFAFETAWTILIILSILQWDLMRQPPTSEFFFLTFRRGSSLYYPKGAGAYFLNGRVLVSTAHANLIYMFWTYVSGRTVYTYATLELPVTSKTTILVKRLWTAAFGIGLIWCLSLLSFFYIGEWTNDLVIISYVLMAVIAIKYREALLLSHTQIIRAGSLVDSLYQDIEKEVSIAEYSANMIAVTQALSKLTFSQAKSIFQEEETPVSINFLTKSYVITSYSFDEELKNNYLIANLISAIISFSEEILSKGRESRHFRFQTESFSIVSNKIGDIIVSYIFTGYAPLAEIRLSNFMKEQREQMWIWEKIKTNFDEKMGFISGEDKEVLDKSIEKHFGKIYG